MIKVFFKNLFCFVLLLAITPLWAKTVPIKFNSEDGIVLRGYYVLPRSKNNKTVVLLHGAGSSKEEWESFSRLLEEDGYGVLYYDLRAHGQSTQKKNGEKLNLEYFFRKADAQEWNKMVQDLDLALKYLNKRYKVSKENVLLCGASVGANIAFRYAAMNPEILAVVLLSPGVNYRGVTISEAVSAYGKRSLFVAVSQQDAYSYQTAASLQRNFLSQFDDTSNLTLHVEEDNPGHGVQMFKRWKENVPSILEVKIIDWFKALE